ncbi:MAG: C69 family dipeptidase [Kiritimatiellae bacterium]|nr:C69 family dipeptidase [Kiritimatiellia bacterium]
MKASLLKRLLSLSMGLIVVGSASACTAIIVGKKASVTGHVLVGHNYDSSGMFVRHAFLPRRGDKPAMFWSQIKKPAGGEKVAHFFYNEYGVAVGSNNGGVMNEWDGATFELPDEGHYSTLTDGGIGYELRIRAVETAHTARECVENMAKLVDTYGYSENARNFFVADCDEAWVFMALKGRRYVARRVPDDAVVAYPNCLIFSHLEPGDIASRNIREKGPNFDLIAYYQGPRTWKSIYNCYRWQNMYRLGAGVELTMGEVYPFSVKPAHLVSVQDIKNGLCSHYEGRPEEVKERHPKKSPKTITPICRANTLEALVCILAPNSADSVFHMTVGRPCEEAYGVYQPFAGVLPPDVALGAKALDRLVNHRLPPTSRVRVAFYAGYGVRSNGCAEWIRLLTASPEVDLTFVDAESVCAGALRKCDMLVVPGGDSRTVRKALGDQGAECIRQFVRAGGGYLGTCAGCCLAMDAATEPERGIGLIPYRRLGSKDVAMMPMRITDSGATALGLPATTRPVRYSHGPVLVPIAEDADKDRHFDVWGTYAGDLDDPGKSFAMRGNVAMVGGTFGKGRVFAIALHPESFVCTRDIVRAAMSYVAGRPVTFPVRERASRALSVGYFTPVMAGITTAQALAQLDVEPSIDLFPIAADEIRFNMLDHLDVLVLPDGVAAWYARQKTLLTPHLADFVARGGKVYGWGEGARHLPAQGVSCRNFGEVLQSLLK